MMKKVMRIFIQFDFLARDTQTFDFIWKDLDLFFFKRSPVSMINAHMPKTRSEKWIKWHLPLLSENFFCFLLILLNMVNSAIEIQIELNLFGNGVA